MTSQSFKFKDHPRCPLCKTYSLFRFIPEAPNKVEITCRNHMNTSYFLDEYMESIANIEAEDNILKCEIHSGKPYRYFCFDCNKHYCTTCKNNLYLSEGACSSSCSSNLGYDFIDGKKLVLIVDKSFL